MATPTFEFLHKGFVKAVFSDVPDLNITATDMGEGMIKLSAGKDSINRLPTAIGTVAAAEVFVEWTATVELLKASPADAIYVDRYKSNGVVPGTVTFYDDVNKPFTLEKVSMVISDFGADATNPARTVKIVGNLPVNTDLIAELGSGS